MKISGIYKITNIVNGNFYIGQSVDIESRWKSHLYELKKNIHGNEHIQRAWNKYGSNNFTFEIIEECENDVLNNRELYWMNELKPQYNIAGGGDSIYTMLESTKKKISESQSGYNNYWYGKKLSIEHKKKLSEIKKGKPNGLLGRKRPEWVRKKLSESQKGRIVSQETREKLRKANTGRKHSDEFKKKVSESHKGEKSHLYGKPSPKRKKVICLDDGKIFDCIMDAAKYYGAFRNNVSSVCNGKLKTTKGLRFKFIESDL